jgi:hypothetical protein
MNVLLLNNPTFGNIDQILEFLKTRGSQQISFLVHLLSPFLSGRGLGVLLILLLFMILLPVCIQILLIFLCCNAVLSGAHFVHTEFL